MEGLNLDSPTKTGGAVSLKDQLTKKTQENNDSNGKLRSDPILNIVTSNNKKNESSNLPKEVVGTPISSPKPRTTLTDSDWTELLGTPSQPAASAATPGRSNAAAAVRGLRKNGRRQGSVASASSVSEVKRNQKSSNGVSKSVGKTGNVEGNKVNGKALASNGDESGFSDSSSRSSSVKLQRDGKYSKGRELGNEEVGIRPVTKTKDKGNDEKGGAFGSENLALKASLQSVNDSSTPEMVSVSGKVDVAFETKMKMANGSDRLGSAVTRKREFSNVASRSSTSDDLKRGSSMSGGSSDSDSDAGSSSDSEIEGEREERRRKREKILAEKAAAKALEAIKERENMVARLEGEKQSLEKILEEETKQQAQEVKSRFYCQNILHFFC